MTDNKDLDQLQSTVVEEQSKVPLLDMVDNKKERRRQKLIIFISILVASAIFLGVVFGLQQVIIPDKSKIADPQPASYEGADERKTFNAFFEFSDKPEVREKVDKLYQAYSSIKDYYYKDLSDEEIIDAMTKGLLNSMDSRYTRYISAEENQQMKESMSGEYSGIGCTIQQGKDMQFVAADLVDDGPAMQSGIQVNDVFLSIDDVATTEFADVSELAAKVRGEADTKVKIHLYRPSENKELDITITRAKITNSDIHYKMLTEDVGYVRITTFDQGLSDNFIAAMNQLQKEGAKNVIFDLRGNTGGYVDEVTKMLDFLLPEGTIITTKGRRDGEDFNEEYTSDSEMGVPKDMRYVILTNKHTASASELFSGCLRDYDKAILVGEKTFGKGVGTISFDFADNSGVNITNFYYYLPKGDNIDGKGLQPDFEVELNEDVRNKSIGQLTPEDDSQLKLALEKIKEY